MTYRVLPVHPSIGAPIIPFAAPPAEPSSADEIDWAALMRIARRRIGLILAVPLVVTAIALPTILSIQPTYMATARVAIQRPEVRHLAQSGTDAATIEPDVALEVERIASRANVETVFEKLSLAETPEYAPRHGNGLVERVRGWFGQQEARPEAADDGISPRMIERFYANLSIARQSSSDVVAVSFRAKDAQLAAAVANALAQTHLAKSEAHRVDDIRAADRWVSERVGEQQQRLQAARDALAAFEAERNASGARTLADHANEIETLNARRAAITLETTELNATLARIDTTPGDVLTVETPTLQAMRAELAQKERDLAIATHRLGPKHKTVQSATTEIAELNRAIRSQIEDYRRSANERLAALKAQDDALDTELVAARLRQANLGVADAQGVRLRQRIDQEETALDALEQRSRALQAEIALPGLAIEVLSPASVPLGPVPPSKKLILLGVLMAAGCLGLTIAALVEIADRTVRGHHELRRIPGLVPIGVLPRIRRIKGLWNRRRPWDDALFTDCVRSTVLAMEAATSNQRPASVLVTSLGSRDGHSTVAAAIAREMASMGRKVLLIDADFAGTRPSIPPWPHSSRTGLAEFLRTGEGLENAIHQDRETGIDWLARGMCSTFPTDRRSRFAALLDAARKDGRLVVISGPSVQEAGALLQLAGAVDQTVLVLRWGRSRRHLVAVAAELLGAVGVGTVMTVINGVDPRRHRLYGARDRLALIART